MLKRSLITAFFALAAMISGCEEKPVIPKEEPIAASIPPTDVTYLAQVRAGRTFTVPNLFFVIQAGAGDSLAVSLASRESGPESARLLFGTWQPTVDLVSLSGLTIDFGGASMLNLLGNGVFTATEAYQPKLAKLVIEKSDETVVSGKMAGEFYRFSLARPTGTPEVVDLEITFRAGLWRR